MTDDTPNVAAMVEESLQLLEVIVLCPIDGPTSHQHIGVFRELEMGELVIHRINQLWIVITSYIVIQTTLKLHTTGGIHSVWSGLSEEQQPLEPYQNP